MVDRAKVRSSVMTPRQAEQCWCCRRIHEKRDSATDPWEGRMDGYCTECSRARCDTTDSACPVLWLTDLRRHLESALHHLDCIDTSDDAISEDASTDTVRAHAAKAEVGDALRILLEVVPLDAVISAQWDLADDDETPSRYLAQLANALWRHQNAGNFATLDALRWVCLAVSGDAVARADLDTNPAWRLA